MTKETKIGLLVGLTFIIVFAIILSEKGTSPRRDAVAPEFSVADSSGPNRASSGSETPLNNAGRLPLESQLTPLAESGGGRDGQETGGERITLSEDPSRQPLPDDESAVPPLPESVVRALNSPVIRDVPIDDGAPGGSRGEPSVSLEEAVSSAARGHGSSGVVGPDAPRGISPVIPQVPGGGDSRGTESEGTRGAEWNPDGRGSVSGNGLSEELVRGQPSRGNDGEEAGRRAAARPTEIVAEHTVQPGESVGKIAAKYYGRSTPARVEAIFNANRDVLKSVNAVKASSKLKIPKLLETGQFEPANRLAASDLGTSRAVPVDTQPRIPIPIGESRGMVGSERSVSPIAGIQNERGGTVVESGDGRGSDRARDSRIARDEASGVTRPARVYEVRPGDTLMKIARAQLGDGRRFEEIYKLNRGTMKNKNALKPGMKIVLPPEPARETASERSSPGLRAAGRPDVSLATMGEELEMRD